MAARCAGCRLDLLRLGSEGQGNVDNGQRVRPKAGRERRADRPSGLRVPGDNDATVEILGHRLSDERHPDGTADEEDAGQIRLREISGTKRARDHVEGGLHGSGDEGLELCSD